MGDLQWHVRESGIDSTGMEMDRTTSEERLAVSFSTEETHEGVGKTSSDANPDSRSGRENMAVAGATDNSGFGNDSSSGNDGGNGDVNSNSNDSNTVQEGSVSVSSVIDPEVVTQGAGLGNGGKAVGEEEDTGSAGQTVDGDAEKENKETSSNTKLAIEGGINDSNKNEEDGSGDGNGRMDLPDAKLTENPPQTDLPNMQQIRQLQQIQLQQAQAQAQAHAQALAQAQAQAQVQAQARAQNQSQQNMLFYTQLFAQQNYQNQGSISGQIPNQKENPLFTLANSVPYRLPNDNQGPSDGHDGNEKGAQDSKFDFGDSGANYFFQQQHGEDQKVNQSKETLQAQHESSKPQSIEQTQNQTATMPPSTDWLTPMGLPLNMASTISAAISGQQQASAEHQLNEQLRDQGSMNVTNAAGGIPQMLQYNSINNALQLGLLNGGVNSNSVNGFFSGNLDLNGAHPTQVAGQQSDILLDNAHNAMIRRNANNNGNSITAPKVFMCHHPGCNKTFSRKLNYVSHYQSKHEHKKPFECETCHKSFARHSDRRRHEKSQHTTKKGFVCGGILENGVKWGCGKRFKRKDGLTAHWKSLKAKRKCFENLKEESVRQMEKSLLN